MGQRHADIAKLGAQLIGIAVTATYSQQAFATSLGIDYPLLSDWGGATARDYGVEYDEWKGHVGLAKRSVFIVDQAGFIRYRWATEDAAIQPDLDNVVASLSDLTGRSC